MAQQKPASEGKTQRQKFAEAIREHDADSDESTFRNAVRKIATAPVSKPKKAAVKSK